MKRLWVILAACVVAGCGVDLDEYSQAVAGQNENLAAWAECEARDAARHGWDAERRKLEEIAREARARADRLTK